ncbi:ABC transporter substrate-binding protein [Pseudarthrobacter sp. J75]|uniref:ABC transporter substrate-binding protein n=1 Tax=unclassified Pseudarthrobacter TaxID=2647000 RepID=UPI002E818AF5|nr:MULTISPECIES: ABC transporter substrate-binding protein [unclassified Pseudarthrobacter]MEE2522445.1 ABC transporter substrate-binding protein [Pseudarthrobacter sp. J47]MEE2529224.1 ABC transporter substrate-binding protein [Pseudarthrobacter sp. J75]
MAIAATSILSRRSTRTWGTAVLAMVLLAGTAACSAPAGQPDAQSSDSVKTIRVGASASLTSTSLHLGLSEGIFEDAGLEVEITPITSLSEGLTQVMSGSLDYAFGDVHNTILAQSQGMPVAVAAPVVVGAEKKADDTVGFGNLLVLKSGPIKSAADMNGKTIGTSSLNGTGRLDIETMLKEEGVDTSTLNWVAIPGPQQMAALRQGQIDAATIPEPTATKSIEEGDVISIIASDAALPGAPLYGMVAKKEWIAANMDTAETFQSALLEANTKANSDREAADKAIATFTDLPADLIGKLHLPLFAEDEFEADDARSTVDRMVDFGLLKQEEVPDLGGLFIQY